jgi:hypothetical protein
MLQYINRAHINAQKNHLLVLQNVLTEQNIIPIWNLNIQHIQSLKPHSEPLFC